MATTKFGIDIDIRTEKKVFTKIPNNVNKKRGESIRPDKIKH